MQVHDAAADVRIAEVVVEQCAVVIDRVAEAGGGPQRIRDVVGALAEAGDRSPPEGIRGLEIERPCRDFRRHQAFHLVVQDVRGTGLLRIAQILVVAVRRPLIEIERARHPVDQTARLRTHVELLRHRIVLMQHELDVFAAVECRRERHVEAAFGIRSTLVHVLHAGEGLDRRRPDIVGGDDRGDGLIDVVDAGPVARFHERVRVRIEDVLAFRFVLHDLGVLHGADDVEIVIGLKQCRQAHVIVVRVVQVVVAGDLGGHHIAVLLDEIAGEAQREHAGERQIDRRAQMLEIE